MEESSTGNLVKQARIIIVMITRDDYLTKKIVKNALVDAQKS